MGKNNKPILSVLVDAEKKEQFADLARQHKQSMGWVLNDCIDRMLAANSTDIYSNSVGAIDNISRLDRTGISALNIEEIVKAYVSNHLNRNSIVMTREDMDNILKSYVDTDKLNDVVMTRINEAIDNRILPLIESATARVMADELLKTSTEASVLEELEKPLAIAKAVTLPRKAKPNGVSRPDWVKPDYKPFYDKLAGNLELIAEVAKILSVPISNPELSTSLFELGIHKDDGEPYPPHRVGKIRPVMEQLTKSA